jgi:hypothetical protein
MMINDQQFHQYQQNQHKNHLPPQLIEKNMTYDVRNPGPTMGKANKWGGGRGVKPINGISTLPPPLDN